MPKDRNKESQNQETSIRKPAISQEILEASKQYAKNQKEILKLELEISELNNKTTKSVKEQEAISKRVNGLAQERLKLVGENREIQEKISVDLGEQEKSERTIVDLEKKRRENQREISDLSGDVLKSLRQQKIETGDLDDTGKAVTQNMRASANFGEDFSNIVQVVNSKLESGVNLSDEFLDTIQDTNKIRIEYRDLEQEIAENAKLAAQGKYDSKKVEEDLVKKIQKLRVDEENFEDKTKAFMENRRNMSREQQVAKLQELRIEQQTLSTRQKVLDVLGSQNKILGETSKTSEKTLGVLEKVTSGDFKGALLQKFGLDEINSQLKEKVGGALVNVVNQVKAGDLKGAFSAAGSGLSNLTKLAAGFTIALGIGAIFKLGSFLLDTFMKADAEVAELGKSFGISKDEAKELHHVAVDVANEMGVVGIHSEQIAKGLQEVSANLGGIDLSGAFSSGNAAVQQMVKDTTLLTEKFGLSAEEAGNMSNIAAIAGKSVGEMSMMSSKLGNGIFSAKESMKILAGIPKSIVSSMSKMPEAMIKTAMKAKMLGLDMKQIADIGRKSLDIEQSLEAEMEARVLLGREINLDKMRAAALDGDQETVMNELLKATGSMEDFNKMNVIQKEALAKAAGMEVDQMAEMLGKQEELNKAGLTQSKVEELQKKNADELASLAASTNDENKKAYLEKLAAEKKSESTQAAMASLMQRLQELAVKLVTPLMDMVDAFLNGQDGADAMGGIINGIGGVIKTIVPVIKVVASVIGSILGPLGSILGMFGQTEDTAKGVSEGVSKVSEAVKPVEAGFGGILKVVGAIGAFFIGKSLLGKGLDMLKDKSADVGKTIMTKVGGALKDVAGKATGKLGDKLGGLVSKKGGAPEVPGIGDDVGKSVDKASGVADKAKSLGDKIKDFGKGLGSAIKDIGKGLGNAIRGVLEGLSKGLEALGKGLATMTPIGPVVLVVSLFFIGLGAALLLATPALRAIAPVLMKFAEVIGGVLVEAIKVAGPILMELVKTIGTVLVEALRQAGPIITAIFQGIATVVTAVGGAISGVITTIVSGITSLAQIDGGKLFVTAAGIVALGGAMATFGTLVGGGSLVGGILGGLGSLFGGESPIDQIMKIADKLDPSKLSGTGKAIRDLAEAFKYFAEETGKLKEFDTDKLDSIIERMEKVRDAESGGALSTAVTGVANAVTGFIGNLFGSPEKQSAQPVAAGAGGGGVVAGGGGGSNMANVEKKLDTLISVISQAANQPLIIKFGEKTVEEIKTQLNFKKASNIGVDKGYGKTI